MKTGVGGFMGRLSPRERMLVSSLMAVLLLAVVVGGGLWVRSRLRATELEIESNRRSMAKIRGLTTAYLEKRHHAESIWKKMEQNPYKKSPDSPVKQVSLRTQVRYRASEQAEEEKGSLNRFLTASGELQRRQLRTKGRRKKKKDERQLLRVEKTFVMKRGNVHVDDFYSFLEKLEGIEGLVFISKLHLVRWSHVDPDYVRVKEMTTTTLALSDPKEK